MAAARPDGAKKLFSEFIDSCEAVCPGTGSGMFGADMELRITNDGPVTLVIDSRELKGKTKR
jgi:D-tyrosyl-tRNA(Tyr) deacylase